MVCCWLLLKLCWGRTDYCFSFPTEESLRKIWIEFVNRKDWEQHLRHLSTKNISRKSITGKVKMTSVSFSKDIEASANYI